MRPPSPIQARNLRRQLLAWYDIHRRDLPWRAKKGQKPDPYHVWISEVMLQQTTVATVKAYFQRFLARWPKIQDLAAASLDDVLHAWQGLGYYSRGRNLHKAAQIMRKKIPQTYEELKELPGLGPYTAGAIAAIAFDQPVAAMDANVERVLARMFGVKETLPKAKKTLREIAAALTPKNRPGDFLQAEMDLGATICKPRDPLCPKCPWKNSCIARKLGIQNELPKKALKKTKPTRHAWALWLENPKGEILIRRRADKGMLGGMMEVPTTEWGARSPQPAGKLLPGEVRHSFTHFDFVVKIVKIKNKKLAGQWVHPRDFHRHALPTVMKKILKHGLKN
ncbi:MAG: A/G-specific adenine glycosylase [Dongiaceae bacterium]